MENNDVINNLILKICSKIVPIRIIKSFSEIERLARFLDNDLRYNPLIYEILKYKARINAENLSKGSRVLNNLSHDQNKIKEIIETSNYFRKNPRKVLEICLGDFKKFYHKISKDINKGLFIDLLDILLLFNSKDSNIINNIFDILRLKNEIFKRTFPDEILSKIQAILTNKQNNLTVRIKIFEIFEKENLHNLDPLIEILKDSEENFNLKTVILNRLYQESKTSPYLNRLDGSLLQIYSSNQNIELNQVIENILEKRGKICASCKSLINENIEIDQIQFCHSCNNTFCEKCLNQHKIALFDCNYCDKLICSNCQESYQVIDLENRNYQLCEICLRDGKYQNGQIICTWCLDELEKCKNCGKIICMDHYLFCEYCEGVFCKECNVVSKCHGCESPVCSECINACAICNEIFCPDCITECPDCGKKICDEDCEYIRGNRYCKECAENWKEYAWEQYRHE